MGFHTALQTGYDQVIDWHKNNLMNNLSYLTKFIQQHGCPLPHKVNNTACAFQITYKQLSLTLKDSWMNKRSMLFNNYRQWLPYQTCLYNLLLPWEFIDMKLVISWGYFMSNICTYCVLTLYGSFALVWKCTTKMTIHLQYDYVISYLWSGSVQIFFLYSLPFVAITLEDPWYNYGPLVEWTLFL